MNQHLPRVIAAAVLGAAATLSQAATVNFTGWAYGNSWSNTVNVVSANDPLAKDNGAAGAFTGKLTFNGTEDGFSGSISNFVSYCVELSEFFYLPSGDMTNYSVVDGSAYGEWTNANANGKTAAQTASRVGQLMSYASAKGLIQNAAESTSLQLAIWNVIYDTDSSLNAGIFQDKRAGSPYDAFANTLLADSAGWGSAYDVYVLTKNGSQDFLLTGSTGGNVPEPATPALVVLALGAAGIASRRKRS